ncbi:putative orphan protein [Pseudoalteromonas translucida]|uniref:Orphan protein n=1 Tax=Pseudoalteromonas translucida (strain TAC 125) TaxID=326442 RepID=Q3IGJ7_PSET1|nr:putative orphan protein [Pseudoalteromonas translucida]
MAHCTECTKPLTTDEITFLDGQCEKCEYEVWARAFSLCTFCNSPLYQPIKLNGELYCSSKCAHVKEVKHEY